MFNDIIDEMITEEVDVEQAEVVMAIREHWQTTSRS